MKITFVNASVDNTPDIKLFGLETHSQSAHWGKGFRDAYIIHFILSGEGFFNSKKITAGEGFLITPGQIHEYHSSQNNPWSYFWVTLSPDSFLSKSLPCSSEGIFEYNLNSRFLTLCDSIISENSSISDIRAKGYFYLLVSSCDKSPEVYANHYVSEAKEIMASNLHKQLTIIRISEMLHINDRYLYNLFIRYEKCSPKQYLNKLKLERAKSLLNNTDFSITEISVSLGFPDVLTFSKFFSKHIGISPKQYRMITGI